MSVRRSLKVPVGRFVMLSLFVLALGACSTPQHVEMAATPPTLSSFLDPAQMRTIHLPNTLRLSLDFDYDTPRAPEFIWISQLVGRPKATIDVEFRSRGCFHYYQQSFRFVASAMEGCPPFVEVGPVTDRSSATTAPNGGTTNAVRVALTDADIERLDNLLATCRSPSVCSSTTIDSYRLTWNDGDGQVKHEEFENVSCEGEKLIVLSLTELSERSELQRARLANPTR